MTAPFPPLGELVAVAWIRSLFASDVAVGTTLPNDVAQWPTGFVQVSVTGGSPLIDIPVRRPVMSIDCWAAPTQNTGKPPWGRAAVLAEQVRLATEAQDYQRSVALPASYRPARVTSAYLLTEPQRIDGDEGNFARYQMDLQLHWREF